MRSTPNRPFPNNGPIPACHATLCLVVFLFTASSPVFAERNNDEQLRALRTRIETLQTELNEMRGARAEARAQLRESERRLGKQLKTLRDTEARTKSESARLASLQTARSRARAELATRRQELDQAVRAAYMLGKQDYLKLLLNQDNPARVSRMLTYYRYHAQARTTRIEGLDASLARLSVLEQQISERVQDLSALRAQQLEQQQALQATRAERRQLLTQLNEKVRDRSQEIERLKQDEERIARLVHALRVEIARAPLPEPQIDKPNSRARWRMPVQGRITARFGAPKQVGDLRWRGIFLATSEGQEVKAVTRGRVVYADWLRGFGLLLVVDHGSGIMTLYGHNQSLYKTVGDRVEAGETLAASGNTGGPEQPGLYFEIREHGEPRNPLDWCRL